MRNCTVVLGLVALAGGNPACARSYLVSITGLNLKADESIAKFTVKTWAVEIKAVCRIPADWEITAGRFGPSGRIAGEAGHGATALRDRDLSKLHDLALVSLSGPVTRRNRGSAPPTFDGEANIYVGRSSTTRTMRLTADNIRLVNAESCARN
jgi:hypothetical protein